MLSVLLIHVNSTWNLAKRIAKPFPLLPAPSAWPSA